MKKEKKFDYKKHIMPLFDDEIEVPINDDFGKGLTFKTPDEKRDIVSKIIRNKEGYREVTLEITSLRGSAGAVHYYATIKDYSLCFVYLEEPDCATGGYSTKNVPKKYTDRKIEIYRPVTMKDIKHDEFMYAEDYRMYRRGKKGQKTRGFWTEENAVKTGIELFKAIYRGKWKLRIEYYSNKKPTILKLDKISN